MNPTLKFTLVSLAAITLWFAAQDNTVGDIGIRMPNKTIADGDKAQFLATLWVGPKLQEQMAEAADNLDLVVDYGWLCLSLNLYILCCPTFIALSATGSLYLFDVYCTWCHVPTNESTIYLNGQNAYVAAETASHARTYWRWSSAHESRDDGALQKEKVNPLGIAAVAPTNADFHCSLPGVDGVGRVAPLSILWLDYWFVGKRPILYFTTIDGRFDVYDSEDEPDNSHGPNAAEDHDLHASNVYVLLHLLPSGLAVLAGIDIVTLIQQTLIYKSLEKKGLHSKSA